MLNYLTKIAKITFLTIFCFVPKADSELVNSLNNLKKQIIELESKIKTQSKSTEDVIQPTKIIKNLTTEVKVQTKFLGRTLNYLQEIQNTAIFLHKNTKVKTIFYTDIIYAALVCLSSLIGGLFFYKALNLYKLSKNTRKIVFYIASIINFEIIIHFTLLNSNIAKLISVLFVGLLSINGFFLLLKSIIKIKNPYLSIIVKNTLTSIKVGTYLLGIVYSGNIFTQLAPKANIVTAGMMQLQQLLLAGILIGYIWSVKTAINKYLLKLKIGFKNSFTHNIIFMWHWLLTLIISLLFTSTTIKTNALAIILNIFLTIIVLPAFTLFMRVFKGQLIKKIKKYPCEKRSILIEWYYRSKKFFNLIRLIAEGMLVLYIWNINLIQSLKNIFTEAVFIRLVYVFVLFYAFMLAKFLIDYFFLVRTNGYKEQMNRLFRWCAIVIIFLSALLILIVIMDRDPSPLISSLGFVSVGITFGAQSIIKDVFSGFLLVLDHTIAVGDEIIIDGERGVIEDLNLCTLKVRQDTGAVVTWHYGDLKKMGNRSQQYCFSVIKIPLSLNSDHHKAMEIMQEAYTRLKASTFSKHIMAPILIRGIDKIDSNEMILSAKIKVKPKADMLILRAYNNILKELFDENNIKMPENKFVLENPHITVLESSK